MVDLLCHKFGENKMIKLLFITVGLALFTTLPADDAEKADEKQLDEVAARGSNIMKIK